MLVNIFNSTTETNLKGEPKSFLLFEIFKNYFHVFPPFLVYQ
jgi:hypothetical protein